jgi:hypothetical protein
MLLLIRKDKNVKDRKQKTAVKGKLSKGKKQKDERLRAGSNVRNRTNRHERDKKLKEEKPKVAVKERLSKDKKQIDERLRAEGNMKNRTNRHEKDRKQKVAVRERLSKGKKQKDERLKAEGNVKNRTDKTERDRKQKVAVREKLRKGKKRREGKLRAEDNEKNRTDKSVAGEKPPNVVDQVEADKLPAFVPAFNIDYIDRCQYTDTCFLYKEIFRPVYSLSESDYLTDRNKYMFWQLNRQSTLQLLLQLNRHKM